MNLAMQVNKYISANLAFQAIYDDNAQRNGFQIREAFGLGFNLSGYYKFVIMENIEMENILTMYTDYLANIGNVDVDYQTNIRFKVNKHIKMQMTFHTIMDDDASSRIQFRQLFGLGVNYSFHEKVTY